MNQQQNNIFKSLSSFAKLNTAAKIQLIGSSLLILSLFLNWYSDVDVFRSGDTYTGLNGPMYFVGLNLLAVAIANMVLTLGKSWRVGFFRKMTETSLGKLQMFFGFGAMYLLIIVNSVYFNPQFGLNILSKKSEIGVMVALVSTVLICVGGYLAFRKKFDLMEQAPQAEMIAEVAPVEAVQERAPAIIRPAPVQPIVANAIADKPVAAPVAEERPAMAYSGAKTDYERSKAYESLKKMMLKDTLTPDQRRREMEKGIKENAFSANFGKEGAPIKAKSNLPTKKPVAAAAPEKTGEKKPQMYRMDL